MTSSTHDEQLMDGQNIVVDRSAAQRCPVCRRLKHFTDDSGRCPDCRPRGVGSR